MNSPRLSCLMPERSSQSRPDHPLRRPRVDSSRFRQVCHLPRLPRRWLRCLPESRTEPRRRPARLVPDRESSSHPPMHRRREDLSLPLARELRSGLVEASVVQKNDEPMSTDQRQSHPEKEICPPCCDIVRLVKIPSEEIEVRDSVVALATCVATSGVATLKRRKLPNWPWQGERSKHPRTTPCFDLIQNL